MPQKNRRNRHSKSRRKKRNQQQRKKKGGNKNNTMKEIASLHDDRKEEQKQMITLIIIQHWSRLNNIPNNIPNDIINVLIMFNKLHESYLQNLIKYYWTCDQCTFCNHKSSQKCMVCNKQNLQKPMKRNKFGWICNECTIENKPQNQRCYICNAPKLTKLNDVTTTQCDSWHFGAKKIINLKCHCGSGKKYKKCHGKLEKHTGKRYKNQFSHHDEHDIFANLERKISNFKGKKKNRMIMTQKNTSNKKIKSDRNEKNILQQIEDEKCETKFKYNLMITIGYIRRNIENKYLFDIPFEIKQLIYYIWSSIIIYKNGDMIDVRNIKRGQWCSAIIIRHKSSLQPIIQKSKLNKKQIESMHKLSKLEGILVRYIAQKKKNYEEWIFIEEEKTICCCNQRCKTPKNEHKLTAPNNHKQIMFEYENSVKKSYEWNCEKCTFKNSAYRAKCKMCNFSNLKKFGFQKVKKKFDNILQQIECQNVKSKYIAKNDGNDEGKCKRIRIVYNDYNAKRPKLEIEQFLVQLFDIGLAVRYSKNDGNCLFRAISDQLDGDQHNHLKYRKEIIEYMKVNKNEFEPFFVGDYDEYLQEMSGNGIYGGNMELIAASKRYKIDITIHRLKDARYEILYSLDKPTRSIHISYYKESDGTCCYSSVRRLDDMVYNIAASSIDSYDSKQMILEREQCRAKILWCHNGGNPLDIERMNELINSLKLEEHTVLIRTGCYDITKIKNALKENDNNVESAVQHIIKQMNIKTNEQK